MRRWIFLLLALLCFFKLGAQPHSSEENGKPDSLCVALPAKAISASIGLAYLDEVRDFFTTLNGRYYITPRFSLDATYGFTFEKWGNKRKQIYTFGFKYWHGSKYPISGLSPFVGINYWGVNLPDGDILDGDIITWHSYYYMYTFEIPIGLSYTTKQGLQTSLQLSYIFEPDPELEDLLNIELRVGWRFNFRKAKGG